MQIVKITQHILDVINKKRNSFEMDMPKLDEEWVVKKIKSYPAFYEPCVELEHKDGRWMRLSISDVKIEEKLPQWKKIDYEYAEYFHIGGFNMKYLLYKGYEIPLEDLFNLLDKKDE